MSQSEDKTVASCCLPTPERKGHGFLLGLLYGLVPHTFCILFIVLSIIGATAATSMLKRFLYIPYLFQIILGLSFVFATISAFFYLRRSGLLSRAGVKTKWKYLTVLYGTTIAVNVLLFWVVFPAVANLQAQEVSLPAPSTGLPQPIGPSAPSDADSATAKATTLQVAIPCPGHAPLIIDELRRVDGVVGVRYQGPNLFQVRYDPARLTVDKILAQEVFKAFPAQVRP